MSAAWLARARSAGVSVLAAAVVVAMASSASGAEVRILDGAGGPNGRVEASVTGTTASVMYRGEQHLFYSIVRGDEQQRLRHATFSVPMTFETIDGNGAGIGATTHSVGGDLAAVVHGDRIHVFYEDLWTHDLRHATFNGTRWRRDTLDGVGGGDGRLEGDVGGSIAAATFGDEIRVVYLDTIADDVRLAVRGPHGWRFRTLDGAGGPRGRTADRIVGELAIARYDGVLHVFAYECDEAYGCDLGWMREAMWNGDTWTFRRAFRANASIDVDVVVLQGGDVRIGYLLFDPVCGSCDEPVYFATRQWRNGEWSPVEIVTSGWALDLERAADGAVAAISGGIEGPLLVRWPEGRAVTGSAAPVWLDVIGSAHVEGGAWFYWLVYEDGGSRLAVTRGV